MKFIKKLDNATVNAFIFIFFILTIYLFGANLYMTSQIKDIVNYNSNPNPNIIASPYFKHIQHFADRNLMVYGILFTIASGVITFIYTFIGVKIFNERIKTETHKHAKAFDKKRKKYENEQKEVFDYLELTLDHIAITHKGLALSLKGSKVSGSLLLVLHSLTASSYTYKITNKEESLKNTKKSLKLFLSSTYKFIFEEKLDIYMLEIAFDLINTIKQNCDNEYINEGLKVFKKKINTQLPISPKQK